MNKKILLWDNGGTIVGPKSPNDSTKIILPNVKKTMQASSFNCIVSGTATSDAEAQNFDPDKTGLQFIALMGRLPVNVVTFCPTSGGTTCYVVIKKMDGTIVVKKAHEEPRYKEYIGHFKKPGVGMFVVMRDVLAEEFGLSINKNTSVMIGDTWHDQTAATSFGIPFVHAQEIHESV